MLSRALHPRGAEDLPSDFCHPIFSLPKLHPCSRRSKKHPGSHPTSSRDSPVHAGRACFGGTARVKTRCSLADLVAIFTSDVPVASSPHDPSLSAERRAFELAEATSPRDAVTRRELSSPGTPSAGVDSSAWLLAEWDRVFARTRLEPRGRRGTPLRSADDFLSPAPARAHAPKNVRSRCSCEG